MSSRTPNEDKALAWYCVTHDLMPQLSTHPIYYFTNRVTGAKCQAHIMAIRADWERWRDQNRKLKDRKRNATL